ncbi:FHA domain-containing protein [Zeimonas arvi]|uniref:FHA domain-containing protein n=1 Tax=Zeimonas arvi TaxID=2498847 RepID=A0A5C8NYN7_9BURK|nr:FHA domain-containing protein [Zeimonas arvi]TXL66379.1 FHA domain-containing protein [Zeimonas arvi]
MPGSSPRGLVPALRLYLAAGAVELRLVPIAGNMLSIGRRPYNDVQLDDLTVSGEHALIRVRNGAVVVHDLGSRNGTLVNGLPIQQRTLVDGDVVDIGIYRLRFEAARSDASGGDAAGAEPDSQGNLAHAGAPDGDAPTGLAGSAGSAGSLAGSGGVATGSSGAPSGLSDASGRRGGQPASGPLAAADADPALPAHVVYLSGPQSGHTHAIDRAISRVGGLAGQVAVISRRKGGYFITHLEGLTFPQVNGEPIGLTAHRLADGDLIELAGTMLRFRLGA